MILTIISSFASAVLSLAVAAMSIAILIFKKSIRRRYGRYVANPTDHVATEREENALRWISRLLWTIAILSTAIAIVNIGVAVLRLVG